MFETFSQNSDGGEVSDNEKILLVVVGLGQMKTLRTKHRCFGVIAIGVKVLYPSGHVLQASGDHSGEIGLVQDWVVCFTLLISHKKAPWSRGRKVRLTDLVEFIQ